MATIYQDLGKTDTRAVSTVGATSLWSLDLSSITEDHLLIEVKTILYDPLNNTTAFYYFTSGIYKNSSATVAAYTVSTQESDYSYDGGDSRILAPLYIQSTNTISQEVNVLLSGSRTLTYTYQIRVVGL